MRQLIRQLGLAVLVAGGLARPAPAGLTLTSAAAAQGLSLSTFASGFGTYTTSTGVIGPIGTAFPTSGGVMVTDVLGNVLLFPTNADNQNAASATINANYGGSNAVGLGQLNGSIYMASEVAGNVVQINNNGTFNQYILTGFSGYDAVVGDQANGRLYVTNGPHNAIYEVDPIAKTRTLFASVTSAALSLSPDGSILYAGIYEGPLATHIVGYNISTQAMVFDSGPIPMGGSLLDGVAVGTGPLSGFVFANTTGGMVVEVNLNTSAQTTIATNGSRGNNMLMDPSTNTLLITQSDSIVRLSVVPEPSSLVLTGIGVLAGLGYGCSRWRRRG